MSDARPFPGRGRPPAARRALRAYLLDYYFHLPPYHKLLAELGFEDTANALRQIGHPGDTKADVETILADPRVSAAGRHSRRTARRGPDRWYPRGVQGPYPGGAEKERF